MSDKQRARAVRDRLILASLAAGLSVRRVGALWGLSAARVCQIRDAFESLAREKSQSAASQGVASIPPRKTERDGRRKGRRP